MKTKVIGIGDNVCDKYYPAKIMYPGGQAMNFSVYAKMLGADAAYMGVFGRDEVADHVIRTLDELGGTIPGAASMTGKTAMPRYAWWMATGNLS